MPKRLALVVLSLILAMTGGACAFLKTPAASLRGSTATIHWSASTSSSGGGTSTTVTLVVKEDETRRIPIGTFRGKITEQWNGNLTGNDRTTMSVLLRLKITRGHEGHDIFALHDGEHGTIVIQHRSLKDGHPVGSYKILKSVRLVRSGEVVSEPVQYEDL